MAETQSGSDIAVGTYIPAGAVQYILKQAARQSPVASAIVAVSSGYAEEAEILAFEHRLEFLRRREFHQGVAAGAALFDAYHIIEALEHFVFVFAVLKEPFSVAYESGKEDFRLGEFSPKCLVIIPIRRLRAFHYVFSQIVLQFRVIAGVGIEGGHVPGRGLHAYPEIPLSVVEAAAESSHREYASRRRRRTRVNGFSFAEDRPVFLVYLFRQRLLLRRPDCGEVAVAAYALFVYFFIYMQKCSALLRQFAVVFRALQQLQHGFVHFVAAEIARAVAGVAAYMEDFISLRCLGCRRYFERRRTVVACREYGLFGKDFRYRPMRRLFVRQLRPDRHLQQG